MIDIESISEATFELTPRLKKDSNGRTLNTMIHLVNYRIVFEITKIWYERKKNRRSGLLCLLVLGVLWYDTSQELRQYSWLCCSYFIVQNIDLLIFDSTIIKWCIVHSLLDLECGRSCLEDRARRTTVDRRPLLQAYCLAIPSDKGRWEQMTPFVYVHAHGDVFHAANSFCYARFKWVIKWQNC